MKKPLVSIIIPTFNNQNTISTCLDSVKKQTYEPIEVIIVDGGSRDSTLEICNRYRVNILRTNLGMAAARLEGAQHSNGKYLFHIDSDMELPPRVIEECVAAMDEYDALIIPEVNVGRTYWAQCTDVGKRKFRENEVGNARFLSRDLYFDVGGHNPELLNREDREFHELLKKNDASIGHTSEAIRHHLGDMGLSDIISKRFNYIQSLDNFEESSRIDEFEEKRSENIDRLSVIANEFRARSRLVPGFLFISLCTFIISKMTVLYKTLGNKIRSLYK